MLTDEMLAGVCFQAIVEDQSLLRVLIAQAREANALRQRCEDLELMLRLATSHVGTSWLTRHNNREFWLNIPPIGEHFGVLHDDGTGLPVMTDELRKALEGNR